MSSPFCNSELLTQMSGLVFDDNNNLYACNFGTPTSCIIKIDKHGNATQLTEQYTDRNFVSMVYLDNFLYVTGFNNCIYKILIFFFRVFALLKSDLASLGRAVEVMSLFSSSLI